MKRYIAFSLSLVMILLCIVPISASSSSMLTVGNVEGGKGEEVIVPISIVSNPGFVSMSLSVTYDTSALTLISCEYTEVISGSVHSSNYNSPYKMTWVNDILTSNITKTGTIAYLTFLVSEDAKEQDYSIIVRIPTDGILDANGNSLDVSAAQGTITVSEAHICSFGDWEYYSKTKHVRYCEGCDTKEYKNHNWNDGEIIEEPTHDVEGEIEYTCEDCNYSYTTEIDPEGHTWSDWTKLNSSQHKRTCSCGDVEYEEHNWDSGVVTKQPTSTQAGVRTYSCEECNASKTESIPPNTVSVTGITLNKTSATLNVGNSISLIANVAPSNATNQTVTWSFTNSYVASVVNGVVTANNVGQTTIKATTVDGGFVAQCVVTVISNDPLKVPVTGIDFNDSNISLNIGEIKVIQSNIYPVNATNRDINWASSNPTVVSIDGVGSTDETLAVIKANASGTAIITATTEDGGFVATCTVIVNGDDNIPVAGIAFDKNNIELIFDSDDDHEILNATILPTNAINTEIVWKNSNESVVDMAFFDGNNSQVLLVALSPGTATITATTVDGGFVASCIVTVKEKVDPTAAVVMIDNVTATSGKTMNVTVSIKNNPGIWGTAFRLPIDTEVFEFVSADTNGSIFSQFGVCGYDEAAKAYKFNGYNRDLMNNITENGTVVVITLKVKDGVEAGEYKLSAKLSERDIINADGTMVSFASVEGTVEVIDYILGDVNGDTYITNADVLMIFRYIYNPELYPVNVIAADVNHDSYVTNADVLAIFRYIYNSEIYPIA